MFVSKSMRLFTEEISSHTEIPAGCWRKRAAHVIMCLMWVRRKSFGSTWCVFMPSLTAVWTGHRRARFRWQPHGTSWIYLQRLRCVSCNVFQRTSLTFLDSLCSPSPCSGLSELDHVWYSETSVLVTRKFWPMRWSESTYARPTSGVRKTCHQHLQIWSHYGVISPKGLSAAILSHQTFSFHVLPAFFCGFSVFSALLLRGKLIVRWIQ